MRGRAPNLVDDTNYALDPEIASRAKIEIIDLLPRIKDQRRLLESMWERFEKVWSAKQDIRLYEGRSDLYFPIGRKVVETQVAHTKAQLFPTADSFYIEPSPDDPVSIMAAPRIARIMRHDVEQAKVERYLDLFLRQMFIYGPTIVKFFWKTVKSTNYRLRAMPETGPLAEPGAMLYQPVAEEVLLYEGPTFQVVDLFRWYIHPITVQDIDDAQIIFEEADVTRGFLQSMEDEEVYAGVDRVLNREQEGIAAANGGADESRNARLSPYGLSIGQIKPSKRNEWRLTEVWAKFDLYGDGYEMPVKITVVDDIIIEIRQNPFWHQRFPYRAVKYIDTFDNFYGQGLIESLEHQQYALNALTNQAIDAVIFQTNHIIAVNTAALDQDVSTLRIAPRAIWKVIGSPKDAIEVIRPPDNSQAAFATAQLIAGMMQDTANAPPVMQGKMSSKEMTAFENATLMQGAQTGVMGTIRNVESSVLSPMLQYWYMMEQQFRAFESYIKIAGMPPIPMSSQDLVGDYSFRWMVSSQVPPFAKAMGQDQPTPAGMPGSMLPGQQDTNQTQSSLGSKGGP